jgi:hypothetical protein
MRKWKRHFSNVFVVILSVSWMWGCQSTAVGPNAGRSKGKPVGAIRIQGKDRDDGQTATTSERAVGQQSFHGFIWRKIVLCISDCDQGPGPGWQSSPVQCLQIDGRGIRTDDEPRFVEETHEPHRVLIQQFDGFGPLRGVLRKFRGSTGSKFAGLRPSVENLDKSYNISKNLPDYVPDVSTQFSAEVRSSEGAEPSLDRR